MNKKGGTGGGGGEGGGGGRGGGGGEGEGKRKSIRARQTKLNFRYACLIISHGCATV